MFLGYGLLTMIVVLFIIGLSCIVYSMVYENSSMQYIPTQPFPVTKNFFKDLESDIAGSVLIDCEIEFGEDVDHD